MCPVAESIREAKCWVVLLKTCPELFVLFPRGQGLTSNLLELELRSCLGTFRDCLICALGVPFIRAHDAPCWAVRPTVILDSSLWPEVDYVILGVAQRHPR